MAKKIIFLLLFFLLPLIFDPRLQDFVLIKVIFLEAAVLILLGLWLLEIVKTEKVVWKKTPLNWPLFLLMFFSLAAALNAPHKPTAFLDSYIIHDGFFLNLSYLIVFFLVVNFFSLKELPGLGLTVFGAGVLVAFYGLLEFLKIPFLGWGLPSWWGIYSTVGFHNFSGAYLAMVFLLGVGFYFESNVHLRPLVLAGLGLIFTVLILTESFSAGFGLVIGGGFLFYFLWRRKRLLAGKIMVFWGIFVILFFLVLSFDLQKIPLENQFRRLKIDWTLRMEIWKATLKIIKDYPLSGIGPDNFELIYPRYQTEKFARLSGGCTLTHLAHNEILDVAVSRGLLALLIYLVILGIILNQGFRKIAPNSSLLQLGMAGAIISYLAQNLFSFGEVSITSLFWMLVGCLFVSQPVVSCPVSSISGGKKTFVFLLVLMIFLSGGVFFYFSRIYAADCFFVRAEEAFKQNNWPLALVYYRRALVLNPWRTEYALYQARLYWWLAQMDKKNRLQFVNQGLTVIERALKKNHFQYATYYMRGLLLKASDEPRLQNQAAACFMQALRLNPYRPELLGELR